MRWLIHLLPLTLIALPALSVAQDRKEPGPRSLVDEAAYLTEKSGKSGWVSEEVLLTRDEGKEKAKGQLAITFAATKGRPSGLVTLRWRLGKMNGAVGGVGFELVEKGGKRFIKINDASGRQPVLVLEYSLAADVLTIQGATNKAWTGIFDDDVTRAAVFKPGR